ncbi:MULTISPECIES: WD40/YVTN/BNR-like repeat-containing protein [Ferrimicrobium]|uniref:WD40/YVTN/BNR-like repeat-containing protein n=1 Tax=Ferrimicrobium acidiphilum TaxID=121039 RepID=A0ABV3Y1V8_9ACTN|nr:hypothetical protein [Ferrimicrobium sp.]
MNSKAAPRRQAATSLGIAVAAALLLAACGSSTAKATISSKSVSATPWTSNPRQVLEPAWRLLAKEVAVSINGGLAWTTKAMPPGVQVGGSSVTVTGKGSVLAVESSGANVKVFRASNTSSLWTHESLPIRWPVGVVLGPRYDSNKVNLGENYGTDVTSIAINEGGAQTGSVPVLFVSDNGGLAFVQVHLPTSYGTYQAAMLSSSTGVITGGNSFQGVWFTANSGKNWEPAAIPGFNPSPNNTVGTPVAFGTQIYVPIALGVGTNAKTTLYESTDGGASFKALSSQRGVGSLIVAANGPDIWFLNAPHEIMESSNDGVSWTTVFAPTLAKEVASAELVSPTKAVATTVNYGCTGFKTGCYYNSYQQATTNSGKTWTEDTLSPLSPTSGG